MTVKELLVKLDYYMDENKYYDQYGISSLFLYGLFYPKNDIEKAKQFANIRYLEYIDCPYTDALFTSLKVISYKVMKVEELENSRLDALCGEYGEKGFSNNDKMYFSAYQPLCILVNRDECKNG